MQKKIKKTKKIKSFNKKLINKLRDKLRSFRDLKKIDIKKLKKYTYH